MSAAPLSQWILSFILLLSSLGIILVRQPVHASLCFLLTLLTLATFYLELSAQFIGVMQILVYAGAILVIFMFVIILFQDAHSQIAYDEIKNPRFFLVASALVFLLSCLFLTKLLLNLPGSSGELPSDFGTVQSIGRTLYLDFFFPFEAITLLFLVAVVGALYIARKEK